MVINCYDNNPITFMQFIEFMAAACTEYKQKSILITVPPAILKLAPDIKIPKIKDPWDNTLLPGHVYCYNKSIYSLPEDKGLLSTSCDEQWEYFETPSPIIIKPSTIKENTSIYNLSGLVFTESSFKKAHMGKSYRTYFSVALNIKYWTNIYSKFFKESFKEQENPGKKELT
ncbi:MAG: hypothetical protein FWH35_00090 [Treponema sp.]|nr:hypothetical protein [Treponema sp.]